MDKIKLTPLGGFGEIGKNLLIFEIDKKNFIIDAGIKFSLDEEINYILPDTEYLSNLKEKIQAIFITHGHEDHVGALSKLGFLDVPIYCPPMASEIIKKKLPVNEHNKLVNISLYKKYVFDTFKITWFPVVHSIPDSCGLIIQSKNINFVHTGDFRFDEDPVFGINSNFSKVKEFIDYKCDLLLSDSTNAMVLEDQIGEREIEKTFDIQFKKNKKIIICSFASQISRLQLAINSAKKNNRKVVLMGSTLKKNLSISKKLEIISEYENIIINQNQAKKLDKRELVYFVTGSQGEEFSVLSRMSKKKYNDLQIDNNDIVLMSSSVIPGNENKVFKVVHNLQGLGADVIFHSSDNKLHVSGHSPQNDLEKVIETLSPKFFVPVHGDNDMLEAHKKLAINKNVNPNNIFVLSNGDNLEVTENEAKLLKKSKVIDEIVLRDKYFEIGKTKNNIYKENIISIILVINKKNKTLAHKPFINMFDISNKGKITSHLKSYILENKTFNSFNIHQDWTQITEQFNLEIYKLVLSKFNKKYQIKTIIL